MRNYLNITGLEVALLLNFKESSWHGSAWCAGDLSEAEGITTDYTDYTE